MTTTPRPAKDLTWSLSGADRDQFAIGNGGSDRDFTRGELRFKATPDFEARADSGRNNVYNVTVVVTDSGGNTDTRDVTVTVDQRGGGRRGSLVGAATGGGTPG